MIIIKHRINKLEELLKVNKKYGAEIDLRSYKGQIILNHEPLIKSISFNEWLKHYDHNFLIANIKEEGIEFEVLRLIKKKNIRNYFLLDVTVPQILILNKKKIFNIALRVSKYESMRNIIKYKVKNKWVWVDTFDGKIPLTTKEIVKLKKLNYKLCLVSPELPLKNYLIINDFIKSNNKKLKYFDAVCTKKVNIWQKYEN